MRVNLADYPLRNKIEQYPKLQTAKEVEGREIELTEKLSERVWRLSAASMVVVNL